MLNTAFKQTLLVFTGVWFVYLICAAGYIDTIDADASIETARALLHSHRLSVEPKRPDKMIYAKGTDGKLYSKMGLGTPLVYLPVVALAESQVSMLLPNFAPKDLLTPFSISLVNGFITALIVAVVFFYLYTTFHSFIYALLMACALGFATLLFPYSKTAHREPLQALCLLGAFAFPALSERSRFLAAMTLLGGLFTGMGLLTKLALLPIFMPAMVAFACHNRKKQQWFLYFGPIAIALISQFVFSKMAFGTFWATGYSQDVMHWKGRAWSTPFWKGVWLQTLDPQTGLLFYNPILLLLPAGIFLKIIKFNKSAFGICLSLSIAFEIILHARWWSPTGNNALGPRYLVTILPLFALLVSPMAGSFSLIRRRRAPALFLLLACTVFQLVQVSIKPQQYWALRDKYKSAPPQWLVNFQFLFHKSKNEKEYYRADEIGTGAKGLDLTQVRSFEGYNFWWAHWRRFEKNKGERSEKALLFHPALGETTKS